MKVKVSDIASWIEEVAPLSFQEDYDNAGLLIGLPDQEVSGVLLTIDVTEAVIDEALALGFNMIVAHHPLIFKGLKKITGKNEVQRCVLKAIKSGIAVYAAHTNLDNVFVNGVSSKMADILQLTNRKTLLPVENKLIKLVTFVPELHSYRVRDALFAAGAGTIGDYDACSYNIKGTGTFRAGEGTHPFVGQIGELHNETEVRIEVVLPEYLQNKVVEALIESHPYEVPVYDLYQLQNAWDLCGAGIIGQLPKPVDELRFLAEVKQKFKTSVIRHTRLLNKPIQKVALCGGAGSFLISKAIAAAADIYITGDIKYHEFFDAENKIILADIGHFESEQFTKDIFYEIIRKKMPTFAVQISELETNPINYL